MAQTRTTAAINTMTSVFMIILLSVNNKNFPLHPAKCGKQKSLRLLLAHLDQRKDEGIHCNHALHHCNFYFRVTTLLCRLNADRSPAAPHRTVPDCAPH